jgi:hypothetical protein
MTEGNPKTTEELVFSTPAMRYNLKSLKLQNYSEVFMEETQNGF